MAEVLLGLRFALALLLYLFLGVAFYVLWHGLSQHEREAPAAHTPAQIIVEEGTNSGQRITLRPITAVGRAETNHLIIDDPFASTNHAMILWREDLWWLEDLESHNGTFVNGERITQPVPLTAGDRIRIGETLLRFDTVCNSREEA